MVRKSSAENGGVPDAQKRRRSSALNSIKPSPALVSWLDKAKERITSEPPWRYQPDPASVPSSERSSRPNPAGSREPAVPERPTRIVPDDVRDRFIRVGRDWYFPNGAKAFRDLGQKVTTQTENTEVVRSLLEIAKARDWSDITVSGTIKFKREAWRQGTAAGLTIRGYQPTAVERQMLVRDLARARAPSEVQEPMVDPLPVQAAAPAHAPAPSPRSRSKVRAAAPASSSPSGPTAEPRSAATPDSRQGNTQEPNAPPARQQRTFTGVLIDHGPAPYQFDPDPNAEQSYFLKLQTRSGERVLWGLDFERALADSQVEKGQTVSVRNTGKRSVTVKRRERDEEGRVIGETPVAAHRNSWEVKGESQQASPGGSSKLPPDSRPKDEPLTKRPIDDARVASAQLALRGAQAFAEQRISDPAQRGAFLEAVREHLNRALESGGRVPQPLLRDRERERVPANARTMT